MCYNYIRREVNMDIVELIEKVFRITFYVAGAIYYIRKSLKDKNKKD